MNLNSRQLLLRDCAFVGAVALILSLFTAAMQAVS